MNNKTIYTSVFLLGFFLTTIIFSSCHERWSGEDFYSDYNRVVGPEGGNLTFFRNYSDDSEKEKLVELSFPENALTEDFVFNMYEFDDERLDYEINELGIYVQTPFLYFVPFYAKDGYNEHSSDDIEYHLSINFAKNVGVSYSVKYFSYSEDSRLFRITIPITNEWGAGNNIYVTWNDQYYPDGYEKIDLVYLINGKWTINGWGDQPISYANWEEVDYTFNQQDSTINFEIEDTDYLYVLAEFGKK